MSEVKISPFPEIDSTINPYDRTAVLKSKETFLKDQLVRVKEIEYLRNKLRWCYYREGVNHLQKCRHLSVQYIDLLKEMENGWFKGYKFPYPEVNEQ
ncbi:hypothetical protein HK103_005429 [Boothiomyces macroporosus]|uniref:Uncharacterized protein n=1 Tax=Boothiomyces macroporosus TaxID=261099 RepID=A0AAD5UMT1_9FUNG|nr:hypothetical protein HK103_005429 [Boothiomyces macroporosus]KAJ3311507.1 hypothetical protein HDV04_003994 [Boothiomyces sp. JEL0838]